MIGFLNAAQVTVGLLLLEHNRRDQPGRGADGGSLDVLLSTPLSTRTILVGKWWGAFRQGRQSWLGRPWWPVCLPKSGHWVGYFALWD